MRTLLVAGMIAGAYPSLAISQTERDLDAHEHGAAVLTMVLDEGIVLIDLQSPWYNLVGFEHTPSTDADKQAVNEALEFLANPQNLFTFDAGNCSGQLIEMDVGMPGIEMAEAHSHDDKHSHGDEHAHNEEHTHDDEHSHDDEHTHDDEHAHNDEHKHDEAHDHADHGTHSEMLASYDFDCDGSTMPTTFTAELMQRFPGIETLQVEFVGPGGQSAATVTASSVEVSLEPVL